MMRRPRIFLLLTAFAGVYFARVHSKKCHHDKFDCKRWAKKGVCEKMKSWMEANCCQACRDVHPSEKHKKKCVYMESTCTFWAKQNFCTRGVFKEFMKDNCCKTCSEYRSSTTHAPRVKTTSGCVDDKSFCAQWAKLGYCTTGQFKTFMKKHCCKTCSALRPATTIPLPTEEPATIPLPTEEPACTDDKPFCGNWAKLGYCTGKYKSFMKKHCCKSCSKLPHHTEAPRTATTPPSCIDDNKQCESWAKMGECTRSKDFMKLHCCKSCSKKPTCVDDRKLCKAWAQAGECTKSERFMKAHCCKSCKELTQHHTTPTPKTGKPTCVDDQKLCASWAEHGECKKNPGYMLVHCKKSCKVC